MDVTAMRHLKVYGFHRSNYVHSSKLKLKEVTRSRRITQAPAPGFIGLHSYTKT